MKNVRWLRWLGIAGAVASFVVGATSVPSDYMGAFICLGVMLGGILVGIDEILHYLKNGGKKE